MTRTEPTPPALSIASASREVPDAPFLVSTAGEIVTYGAMAERARAAHVEDARLDVVVADRSVETVARIVAGLDAPRALALLHPRDPAPTQDELRRRAASAPESVLERAPVIVPTSGSTGRRKLAVLSRRALAAAAAASHAILPLGPEDRWLLAMPLAHVGGLSIVTRALAARATVALVPEGPLDAGAVGLALERCRVTVASFVPTMLDRVLESAGGGRPPRHLRAVLVGGAAASPALLERAWRAGWPVRATYGLTETSAQVATAEGGARARAARPLPGVEVSVRADGRVRVAGPTLFDGYLTDAGIDDARDADGFFVTDDFGALDADGRLSILGRTGELIVSGGENVYPAEVEAALDGAAGVERIAVFGAPDERWGEIVCAAVVARSFDRARFDAEARARLAPHARPRMVVEVTELPLTASGKLDRAALAALARFDA